jgi:hypothetical protein
VALEGNWAEPRPGQQAAYYLARDAAGTPLAFTGVALFGESAVLFAMFSHLGRYPCASWARYQLHTCLALDLGSSGVEYLLVGSALRETAVISTSSTCWATTSATCASRPKPLGATASNPETPEPTPGALPS